MGSWLLKTEPSEYAYSTLEKEGQAVWDGVSNPVALKNLRSAKAGDDLVIYHTGQERAVVGLARVVREAYPDKGDPKRVLIDIEPRGRLAHSVDLTTIKQQAAFADSPLVRQGRLSVVPLTRPQWDLLLKLGGAT